MSSKTNPLVQSNDGSTTDTGGNVTLTNISLATLAANIQEGFNSNHIGWSSINWDLFAPARPNEVSNYSVSHNLNSISVFIPISAINPPEYLQATDEFGDPVTKTVLTGEKDEDGKDITKDVPVYELDEYGNPIRIVDSAADLFLAIGGSDGNDHLRNRDYTFSSDNFGETRQITGAFMGFSGDDVLYSENVFTPMLMGGSGDDSYILENVSGGNAVFTQIVENGGDANDTVISYENDWAYALDISGQHLVLANSTQSDVVVFWNYYLADAKIENFWFDFDGDGLNEHYSFDEFTAKVKGAGFWQGSLSPEELGISRPTMDDLTQAIAEAVTLSNKVEDFRIADQGVALSVARLYQASFDRDPDIEGLNNWIDLWEGEHYNLSQIADGFYNSSEFTQAYGNLDDVGFTTLLYNNVLDRAPDAPGLNSWVNYLASGATRAEVLTGFSESLENKINTELKLGGIALDNSGDWVL